MLAILQWRRDATARRFAVWMAVGTSFFLGLAAGDFSGTTAVPFEIAGLFLLMCLFVLAGTRRDKPEPWQKLSPLSRQILKLKLTSACVHRARNPNSS